MWGSTWGTIWGSPGVTAHGHVVGAGRSYQNVVRMLLMQEMQRNMLDDLFRQQRRFAFKETAKAVRMKLSEEMERKIAEQDADDLFLVLSA